MFFRKLFVFTFWLFIGLCVLGFFWRPLAMVTIPSGGSAPLAVSQPQAMTARVEPEVVAPPETIELPFDPAAPMGEAECYDHAAKARLDRYEACTEGDDGMFHYRTH